MLLNHINPNNPPHLLWCLEALFSSPIINFLFALMFSDLPLHLYGMGRAFLSSTFAMFLSFSQPTGLRVSYWLAISPEAGVIISILTNPFTIYGISKRIFHPPSAYFCELHKQTERWFLLIRHFCMTFSQNVYSPWFLIEPFTYMDSYSRFINPYHDRICILNNRVTRGCIRFWKNRRSIRRFRNGAFTIYHRETFFVSSLFELFRLLLYSRWNRLKCTGFCSWISKSPFYTDEWNDDVLRIVYYNRRGANKNPAVLLNLSTTQTGFHIYLVYDSILNWLLLLCYCRYNLKGC